MDETQFHRTLLGTELDTRYIIQLSPYIACVAGSWVRAGGVDLWLYSLTMHRGFLVADYIKRYLAYRQRPTGPTIMILLSNYVYPNPPCQLSLWEKLGMPGENPRLSAEPGA